MVAAVIDVEGLAEVVVVEVSTKNVHQNADVYLFVDMCKFKRIDVIDRSLGDSWKINHFIFYLLQM